MRSVAYLALHMADQASCSTAHHTGLLDHGVEVSRAGDLFKEAVALFRAVLRLSPGEPQSSLDLGLSLFFWLRRVSVSEAHAMEMAREAVGHMAKAVVGEWQPRFEEVELPAMVALNWMVEYGRFRGWDIWPNEVLSPTGVAFPSPLRMPLMVWMGWDTDKTDIDLHIVEPSGEEVYYSHPRSRTGGYVTKDFTQGYGPEVFFHAAAPQGEYQVKAKYFGSHQQTAATGGTSVIIWRVTDMGNFDKETMQFSMVRLEEHKTMMDVMRVHVPVCASGDDKEGVKRKHSLV